MFASNIRRRLGVGFGIGLLLAVGAAANEIDARHNQVQVRLSYQSNNYLTGFPHAPTEMWKISAGGRLYDNWMQVNGGEAPDQIHPAWPKSNPRIEGRETWRCVSCHGWDYKGRSGIAKVRRYETGIIGISRMRGEDPYSVVQIIRDPTHRYSSDMISTGEAWRIGLFVTRGTYDTDAFIDRVTGQVNGHAGNGASFFQNVCAVCHDYQGTNINFGSDERPVFVGTKAHSNPWAVLHKIVNGPPGSPMISCRPFGLETAIDILAYLQTLPRG